MNIFEANKACKKIDGKMLLKDVTLSLLRGEKVAITGKNGSGKSSLLKLIAGIYTATKGQVKRAPMNIGYVPEHFPENVRFKVYEYLLYVGKISFHSDEELRKRIKYYTEMFAVTEFLHTPFKECSKGTKQKAGIIQAFLHSPDVLLLDEPLTGLDDQAKQNLLKGLNSLEQDQTIIFTAHDPLLIEGLADRVITIESGRIVSDTTTIQKRRVRRIKTKIPTREMLTEISSIEYEFLGSDTVDLIVSAKESDMMLAFLLERGCSILELTEKEE